MVAPVANSEFYDKKAIPGGCLHLATQFDTGIMNMIISPGGGWDFWTLTTDPLAKRNWKKLGQFQPMLTETWSISQDELQYHIKLRRGVYGHDFSDPVTGK